MTDFFQYNVICIPEFRDILIAEFAQLGFDTFEETPQGFTTVVQNNIAEEALESLVLQYGEAAQFSYTIAMVPKQNWNETWEKNFEPIGIEDKCIVKAPFHTNVPKYPIELTITPKMSFGTGHHETTYQMLAQILHMQLKGKRVMDAGTGTGVLAILAKKKGAEKVLAFDIDDWCVENALENAQVNTTEIEVVKASIEALQEETGFDVVLANINKNILLIQMKYYRNALKPGGYLLLSGFYENDLEDITTEAQQNNLSYHSHTTKNNWAMAVFKG